MNTFDAKLCLVIIVVATLIGDSLAIKFGWCSISEFVRNLDYQSGGWLRWIMLGLWIHWFVNQPWGGWHLN